MSVLQTGIELVSVFRCQAQLSSNVLRGHVTQIELRILPSFLSALRAVMVLMVTVTITTTTYIW